MLVRREYIADAEKLESMFFFQDQAEPSMPFINVLTAVTYGSMLKTVALADTGRVIAFSHQAGNLPKPIASRY
jgi:hypothetical protein